MNPRDPLTYFLLVILTHIIRCENLVKSENNTEMKEQVHHRSDHKDYIFGDNFLLVDIIRFLPVKNSSHQCYTDLKLLKHEIHNHKIWAMKALESSAMLPNNFIYGNNFWLGSRFECESISNRREVSVSKSFYREFNQHLLEAPTLEMSYKVIYATISSHIQVNVRYFRNEVLHLGLCLPKSCQGDVLHNISKIYFSSNDSIIKVHYNITAENEGEKDLVLNPNFYLKPTFLLLGILSISTLILVIASQIVPNYSGSHKLHILLLEAFSYDKNFTSIFNSTEVTFPEINGLRLISNCFILAFHVQYFTFYKLTSKWMGLLYAEDYKYQMFSCGLVFVDAFFAISGFLLMYSYLKNEDQKRWLLNNSLWVNLRFVFSMIVKRFIRIVPLYLIVILLTETTSTYLRETSTITLYENDDYNCRNYWWRNLLFIQNLFLHKELCMNWTWTLANEMQFFVMCTVIYVSYCKNEIFGKLLFSLTVIFIAGSSNYLLIKNNFVPTFDVLFTTLDDLYISPFSRAPPYLVGVGMAYFVVKGKIKISNFVSKVIWVLTISVFTSIFTIPINRNISVWLSIVSFSLGKWILAICFCWLFSSAALGHKNLITRYLSTPTHFGKISFAFYLLNPLLLTIVLGTSDYVAEVDPLVQITFAVGIFGINYMLSIIFTILFDMPYQKLLSNYIKKSTHNLSK